MYRCIDKRKWMWVFFGGCDNPPPTHTHTHTSSNAPEYNLKCRHDEVCLFSLFIVFIRKPKLLMVYSRFIIIIFHLISSLVHFKDIDNFISQFGVSTANEIWVQIKLSSIIIWGWGQSKEDTFHDFKCLGLILLIDCCCW